MQDLWATLSHFALGQPTTFCNKLSFSGATTLGGKSSFSGTQQTSPCKGSSKYLPHSSSLHLCVIKLTPVQSLFMVRPRWCRHAAVGVQQDADAANKQEEKEQHEEADEAQCCSLFRVSYHGLQRCRPPGEPRRSLRGEIIVDNPVVCVTHFGYGGNVLKCFYCIGFTRSEALRYDATLHWLLSVISKASRRSHADICLH